MDFMKVLSELFGNEALTFEQFSAKITEKGYKVADLSKGDYVGKKKYEDDVLAKDNTITELNGQLSTRDTDIKNLKKQLEDGGKDNETKISELTEQLTKLQGDYKTAKSDYEAKLSKQSYEFAVKDFAGTQQFSSNAAKRSFISEMLSAGLKMQDNSILGANDFLEKFKAENTDAFVVNNNEGGEPNNNQGTTPAGTDGNKPMFIQPAPQGQNANANPFDNAFNFSGVR